MGDLVPAVAGSVEPRRTRRETAAAEGAASDARDRTDARGTRAGGENGPRTESYGHGHDGKIRQRAARPSASCPLCGKQRTYTYTAAGADVYAPHRWVLGTARARHPAAAGALGARLDAPDHALDALGMGVEEYLSCALGEGRHGH